MALPAFLEVPPTDGDSKITLLPAEWKACIELWIILAEFYLKLPEGEWIKSLENDESNTMKFLLSYFNALSSSTGFPALSNDTKAQELRRLSFLLNHRVLSAVGLESLPMVLDYLVSLCAVFPKSEELRKLLSSSWKRKSSAMDVKLQDYKNTMVSSLRERQLKKVEVTFTRAVPLLHQMPDVGAFLLTGSDFLDSINDVYELAEPVFQKLTTLFVYLGFLGLLTCSQPNLSMFSDQIYSLKASSAPGKSLLLSDLVSNTLLLLKVKEFMAPQDPSRARQLEQLLGEYRKPGNFRQKHLVLRKIDKGKEKTKNKSSHGAFGHVHLMSLISQVQDLFPDLGSRFIVKLLDEYNEDVEQVTAHLLDNSLPFHLQRLDRTEQLPNSNVPSADDNDLAPHLIPRRTPSPPLFERRNIYDNDELDQLTVDASRLRLGRANKDLTADAILSDRSAAPNKAAILSALAAFDSDDDERDDTYDVEDVSGAVEAGNEDTEDTDKNEEALFNAYRQAPDTFTRDAATRRGKARLALRSETNMTDEAIEGWAVMLSRDPRKLRRLEAKYASFAGQQNTIERTAYREGEDSEEGHSGDRGRGGRARGRGGRGFSGGRGRGGSVAGPANEAGTQKARQGKEANKGSRANHNRRDQRARKMARGGFPG